jgi:predicted ATP-grasp superfamily ATP-dependent carboligase
MSTTTPATILILGASGRAAAFSARRAGLEPIVVDKYGDADLAVCRRWVRVERYPAGLADAAREFPGDTPWIYTGALENRPVLVDRIAAQRRLYGNPGPVLRRVRDPFQVAEVLRAGGLCCPDVRATRPEAGTGIWVRKPLRSAGGEGLHVLESTTRSRRGTATGMQTEELDSDCYYQQFIRGRACSAVYVAADHRAAWLGSTRQLAGARWTGATGFQYSGSSGPLRVTQETACDWIAIGEALAAVFGLVGLFGVDAIVAAGRVWPLEINPRYTASIEVLERALGLRSLDLHLRACRFAEIPALRPARRGRCVGKAIVYAPQDVTIAEEFTQALTSRNAGLEWPDFADIPTVGIRIKRRQPVVTVLADGSSLAMVERQLRARTRQVQVALRCPRGRVQIGSGEKWPCRQHA